VSRIARAARLALLLAVVGVSTGVAAAAVRHDSGGAILKASDKVVICHANGYGSWVRLDTPVSQIFGDNGHAQHPDDIIPPFEYEGGSFPGLNWDDEGQAIYEKGCVLPAPVPQPIGVHATCTRADASTYDAVFGYDSANAADVTIPVGTANGFSPPPDGRGQVTVFHHGPVPSAFTVTGIPRG
jgi:hypothetical protein